MRREGHRDLVGGPFNSGILASGPVEGAPYDYRAARPAVLERVRRIDRLCRRHGVALAAAAMQFPLAHPAISTLIPGAISRAEVLQNADHLRADIPADLWAELKHEHLLHPDAPVPA